MSLPDSPLLETALTSWHRSAGARLVPFAGYLMPVQYSSGILEEHKAVRKSAGLFDVSHMGVARIEGPQAFEFLNRTLTRDLSKIEPGKAAYTLLCREHGGTVDDLIVYRENAQRFWMVLNASNKQKDMEYLRELSQGFHLTLDGPLDDMSLIALQGPLSSQILGEDLPPPFSFVAKKLNGISVWLATTGYTGESGCEIMVPSKEALALWNYLMERGAPLGIKACGLGARDTLRTEMGYSLYGHEITEDINPLEAGLGWAVSFKKETFVGRSALFSAKEHPQRKLIALQNSGRQAPRAEMSVLDHSGAPVGFITSGTYSPSLQHAIGMALVSTDSTPPYSVDMRGQKISFELVQRPFYKPPTKPGAEKHV